MAAEQEKTYCNVAEAARFLGVSETTIWRWIKQQRLPAYRVGPKTIRIKRADLEALPAPVRGFQEEAERAEAKPDTRAGQASTNTSSLNKRGSKEWGPPSQRPAYTVNELRQMAGLPPLTKAQEEHRAKFLAELDAHVVTPEELAERQKLYKKIIAGRNRRNISPLTTSDLIRISREEEIEAYGKPRKR